MDRKTYEDAKREFLDMSINDRAKCYDDLVKSCGQDFSDAFVNFCAGAIDFSELESNIAEFEEGKVEEGGTTREEGFNRTIEDVAESMDCPIADTLEAMAVEYNALTEPNKAYILGLLYADGCNHLSHNSITLSLQESDLSILKSIKKELNYEGPIRFVEKNKKNFRHKNQYVLCINDEYMSKQLERLGMVNAKSLKLLWPTFLPKDLISHFVRGYFDGDGCVWYDKKRNKCETQICGTRNFCENLSIILSNMSCKNSIKHPKQCNENTVVLQTKGNKSSYQILSWIYQDSDLKLDRKYQKYLEFCKSLNKPQLN